MQLSIPALLLLAFAGLSAADKEYAHPGEPFPGTDIQLFRVRVLVKDKTAATDGAPESDEVTFISHTMFKGGDQKPITCSNLSAAQLSSLSGINAGATRNSKNKDAPKEPVRDAAGAMWYPCPENIQFTYSGVQPYAVCNGKENGFLFYQDMALTFKNEEDNRFTADYNRALTCLCQDGFYNCG